MQRLILGCIKLVYYVVGFMSQSTTFWSGNIHSFLKRRQILEQIEPSPKTPWKIYFGNCGKLIVCHTNIMQDSHNTKIEKTDLFAYGHVCFKLAKTLGLNKLTSFLIKSRSIPIESTEQCMHQVQICWLCKWLSISLNVQVETASKHENHRTAICNLNASLWPPPAIL